MSEPAPPPIQVSATPASAQIAAGIRQAGAALGIILAAFGLTAMSGKVGIVVSLAPQIAVLMTVVGPVIWGTVTAVGQLAARKRAKQAATMAAAAPDSVAVVK